MTAIRIGTSLTSSYGSSVSPRDGAKQVVAAAAAARRAGLASLFLGDHHNTGPGKYYQNVPMLGRLLAEWGDAPAGILALLPLWHPTLLAEQVGTLASIAEGRFILQCSLGSGAEQFAALGADPKRRVSAFERVLTTVQALLAGETVDGARIAPVPEEPVEYWIGATAPAGIERAARMADGWLAEPGTATPALRDGALRYLDACARADRPPRAVAVRRDIYVGESDAEAARVTEALIARGYRAMSPEVLVIGSPETVAARFSDLADLGFTDVVVRHMAVPPDDVVASTLRLAGVAELLAGATT